MSDINPGDTVRISGAFTNAAGAATDPTAVTLGVRLRRTGAVETLYTYGAGAMVKDSTGNYHLDYAVPSISPDRGLTIEYEWTGTGTVAAVEQGTFEVVDSYG